MQASSHLDRAPAYCHYRLTKRNQTPRPRKAQRGRQTRRQMGKWICSASPQPKHPQKKPKAQPKKATAASKSKAGKKEPKKEAPAINNVFKATKGGAKPTGKPLAKASDPALTIIESKFNEQTRLNPKENASDTIHIEKRRTPSTPRKPARLTKIKSDFVFQPVSSADSRNNHSPKRPPIESFTPTKDRTPSAQIQEEMAYAHATSSTSDSRPSSSGSAQRHIIESPTGPVPKNMNHLLC